MLPPALDLATLTPTATRPPATPTVCALSEFFDCAVMLTSCAAFSVAPPPRYDSTVDVPVAGAAARAPVPPAPPAEIRPDGRRAGGRRFRAGSRTADAHRDRRGDRERLRDRVVR